MTCNHDEEVLLTYLELAKTIQTCVQSKSLTLVIGYYSTISLVSSEVFNQVTINIEEHRKSRETVHIEQKTLFVLWEDLRSSTKAGCGISQIVVNLWVKIHGNLLSSRSYTVSDQPTINIPRVSISSHYNTIGLNVTSYTKCIEAVAVVKEVRVVIETLVNQFSSSTCLKVNYVNLESIATRYTSTDQAVASLVKLDIVVSQSISSTPSFLASNRVSSSNTLEYMLASDSDRSKHIASSTVNANDRSSTTIDEIHDTILSSHTTNVVSLTRSVSSEVILYNRDYPVVLKVVFVMTGWIGVVLFYASDSQLNTSNITNKLETIVVSSNSCNCNFRTYRISNRIKNHFVTLSRVNTVRESWVVEAIILSDSQTRDSNELTEVLELGIVHKSIQALE